MKKYWAIGALGATGIALMTLPLLSSRLAPEAPATGAAPVAAAGAADSGAGVCDAQPRAADLDFTLQDMDGKKVDLAQYKGHPVLLNFWATWCGPCKSEIPMFVQLQDKYRDKGFVVLGVSIDDPADALQAFAAEYKMNYPVLMADDDIQDAYGPIFAVPISYLITKDGQVCKKHFGPATAEEFDADVRALF